MTDVCVYGLPFVKLLNIFAVVETVLGFVCCVRRCWLLLVRLKPLDIEVMKQLDHKVNIIPLIAKADTMTADECRDFKKTVSVNCAFSLLWVTVCMRDS